MATVKDVMSIMEEIAPLSLCEMYCKKYGGYDNSGLILGDEDRQIFSVLVCLDLTSDVAAEAEDIAADMIITHHPLIYDGIKSITKQTPQGKIIYSLIKNDIAVYAAHMNFDIAPFGVNQIMADKLGLTACRILQPVYEDAGLGRVGRLPSGILLNELGGIVSDITGGAIKVCGDGGKTINTVAAVCGAGGGDTALLRAAAEAGADVYITAEVKHHVAVEAKERGIALIDAGHYATEQIAVPVLAKLIAGYAEKSNLDIEVTESGAGGDPFNI